MPSGQPWDCDRVGKSHLWSTGLGIVACVMCGALKKGPKMGISKDYCDLRERYDDLFSQAESYVTEIQRLKEQIANAVAALSSDQKEGV